MSLETFFADLRNPETRYKTLRTLLVAMMVASGSLGGTMVGTQSAVGLWALMMERVQFPMIVSEIESLRADVAGAPCGSNAMLIAQAADWNRRIRHEHESNRHWYSNWASTDRWNLVEPIAIPCSQQAGR